MSNEQPAILILEVGVKSSDGSQMITTLHDVGGGKSVSTTKNDLADVGRRSTTITGNLFVVFQSLNDVGRKNIEIRRGYTANSNQDLGVTDIIDMIVALPQTDFT